MKSVFTLLTAVLSLSLAVAAQDPTKVAPQSYKLQFENEFVKVLRVTYAAHSKVPVHDHSRFPAAYIYLSDSGPIRFVHTGWNDPVLIRRATRAGSFRLSPTRFEDEKHAVENDGDLASEFLRIEIKTEAPNRASLAGRFAPFEGDRKSGLNKIEFENSQVRITRTVSRAGQRLDVSAPPGQPALVVVVAGAGEIVKGQTYWIQPGKSQQFPTRQNSATSQVEVLRLDFKTKPKKLRRSVGWIPRARTGLNCCSNWVINNKCESASSGACGMLVAQIAKNERELRRSVMLVARSHARNSSSVRSGTV